MRSLGRASFVLLLTLALSGKAFAQSKAGGGIEAGVNLATVSGTVDPDTTKSMRTGGAFGAFVSIPLGGDVSFGPEVLYSMEGVKIKGTLGSQTLESTAKVNVIEIPLLLRVGGGKSGGFFVVGPAIGIIASAKQTDPFGGADTDFKDQLKNSDFSLVVGAGFNVSRLFIEGRYTAGLTDVNKDNTSSNKNRSQVISALVGIRFGS